MPRFPSQASSSTTLTPSSERFWRRLGTLLIAGALLFGGCGDDDGTPVDGGATDSGADAQDASTDGSACQPVARVEPIWIAGATGTRAEVGAFGKPDAIFVLGDHLLAGDEDAEFEELHIFDLSSDDETMTADSLTALADIGADPGPGGDGPLEFRGISGFAALQSGEVVVAEQGNDRLQVLAPADEAPFYTHARFIGGPAANPDDPAPAEFVRLQALRVDSMGRLYVSDDGRDGTDIGRRDIQVFDADGTFLFTFGDTGGALGQDGNLQEPENFAIDEARDRIYVCDEGPNDVVVYRYSDRSFIRRFGGDIFVGTTNGVDFDDEGRIYVVDEGNALSSRVRVFDPDTFEEIGYFGELSEPSDLTPGTFNSPDTLLIDRDADLVVVADQGHDRIQGFRLSEIQAALCFEGS